MKIAAGEGPLEGRSRPLIVALESEETLFELGQRREVVGGKDFSLNDREIDFDLVQPTGVDGSVDEDSIGPFVPQTLGSFVAPMCGTVVHDPEDTTSGLVRFLGHDVTDETIDRSNSVFDFAAAKDPGTMDVPRRQVGPGTFAKILVLDARGAVGSRRQSRVFAAAGLNAGFFVRRNDVVIQAQWSALPSALV